MSLDTGSSPHAWGLPHLLTSAAAKNRFIPTCVGFTPPECPCSSCDTVHPHMRGVYYAPKSACLIFSGSSPHAWGLPFRQNRFHDGGRFIPTCVGFTMGSLRTYNTYPVHPHMRGVYAVEIHRCKIEAGSSPHAWGLPAWRGGCGPDLRFIPTCVGFTIGLTPAMVKTTVHPHMRGVYRW